MKRLIALFLALALCLGLTACGSTGQNETTADAATEAADTTEEPATEGATRTVKDFYDRVGSCINLTGYISCSI